MKTFFELSDLEYFKPMEGLRARLVHTESQTFAFWEIDEGTELPMHQHPHEQVTIVTEGVLELTIGTEKKQLKKGSVAVIPSDTPHSARAISDVEVTDVFYPVREDFPQNEKQA